MKSYLLLCALLAALVATGCGESDNCQNSGCDDGNACTADLCNVESGVCENIAVPVFSPCQLDGSPGVCSAGGCVSMSCEDIDCDDGNPCTVDGCVEGLGACVGVAVPTMTTCEVDGSFGRCNDSAECDLGVPPTGDAELSLTLNDIEATAVTYELACAGDLNLSGTLARLGDDWQASFTLPAGECTLQVFVRDQDGEVICNAEAGFTILPDTLTPIELVLTCNV